MLLFLSGMGTVIGLFLMLGAGYLLGRKNTPKAITKPPAAADDEEAARQKALHENLLKVMNYNEQQAYARKVE